MTFFCKAYSSKFNLCAGVLFALILTSAGAPIKAQQPDATPSPLAGRASYGEWQSGEAVHLIGLPEIKEKEKGTLTISPAALTFTFPGGNASVHREEMRSVSVGDVSIETGGTAGKITRAIIPFGGGSALATVTHKQWGLLTVEFRDQRDALHGAVFLLPKDEAIQAQQRLGVQTALHAAASAPGRCEANGGAVPDTVSVAAINTQGAPVPAEYRMLIYEQIVRRLHDEGRFTAVYRDGDNKPEAACPKYNVVLTLDAFKKGNAAVRASTGPVGFFVGATSFKFQLQVQDLNGKVVFDKQLEASKRGDTDSLDIADKIARTLTKELKKSTMQSRS